MSEHRDRDGNLIAYDNTKPRRISLEVMQTKFEGRMDRIESNVGDARMDIQNVGVVVDHIKSQVAGVCSLTRELTNEVRIYAEIQKEANQEKRLQKVEAHMKVVQFAGRVLMWVVGPLIAAGGLIIGIFKFKGGG